MSTIQRQIAEKIRREFVCCEDLDPSHPICYWGELSARIAEEFDPESDSVVLDEDMEEAIFEAHLEGTGCPGSCCNTTTRPKRRIQ